jgi:hypothetical protein
MSLKSELLRVALTVALIYIPVFALLLKTDSVYIGVMSIYSAVLANIYISKRFFECDESIITPPPNNLNFSRIKVLLYRFALKKYSDILMVE